MTINWIKFRVKKIIDAQIIQAEVLDHSFNGDIRKRVSISGDIANVKKGYTYEGLIKECTTSRVGCICKLDGIPVAIDVDESAIVEQLRHMVKALGKAQAEKIVNKLGKDALQLVKSDYGCLLQVEGLSKNTAKKIHRSIATYYEIHNIISEIKQIESKEETIDKIINKLGTEAERMIRENPYVIYEETDFNFIVADAIAVKQDVRFDDVNRVKAVILSYINNEIERNGDLYTAKDRMISMLPDYADKIGIFTDKFTNVSLETIEKVINRLALDKKIIVEDDINGNTCIYRSDYHYMEEVIVSRVKELLSSDKNRNNIRIEEVREMLVRNRKMGQQCDQQEEAVINAVTKGISIITGGAGTGKSTLVKKIVKILHGLVPHATVELASPTGKAANRLRDITDKEATTIHRLLKLPVGDSGKNQISRIESDFLILDEGSMIDAYLFYQIVSNLGDKTNLILVGDTEQLGSVGAGSILKDLINSGMIPITRLTETYRQSKNSLILENANRLIERKYEEISFDDREFSFVECRSEEIKLNTINIINHLMLKGINIEDTMVLSPSKLGELGTEELNREIRKSLKVNSSKISSKFTIKDRVMQSVNNYKLMVMNGEVGQVVKVKKECDKFAYAIRFGDRKVEYDDTNANELELAFAITIHKSQGSEFQIVILPLDESNMSFGNRNMLYTAMTRSKSKIVLIGSKKIFFEIIKREERSRKSRIIEKLIR